MKDACLKLPEDYVWDSRFSTVNCKLNKRQSIKNKTFNRQVNTVPFHPNHSIVIGTFNMLMLNQTTYTTPCGTWEPHNTRMSSPLMHWCSDDSVANQVLDQFLAYSCMNQLTNLLPCVLIFHLAESMYFLNSIVIVLFSPYCSCLFMNILSSIFLDISLTILLDSNSGMQICVTQRNT